MKHIGLVGGLSPESTVSYYQRLCTLYNQKNGGLQFPEITIRSVNLAAYLALFEKNDWEAVGEALLSALWDLKSGGADFAAITANTPHNSYEHIRTRTPLPILTIMEAVVAALERDGIKKVGLLGTKATMEHGFFQKTFARKKIETLVPDEADRKYINSTIWDELSHGKVTPEAADRHRGIIQRLVEQGAEAVILGCTELPLLIRPEMVSVKLYDTMDLHATAILEHATA